MILAYYRYLAWACLTPLRSQRSGPPCLAKHLTWPTECTARLRRPSGAVIAGPSLLPFRRFNSFKAPRVSHCFDNESQNAAMASCCDPNGLFTHFHGGTVERVVVASCSSSTTLRRRFRLYSWCLSAATAGIKCGDKQKIEFESLVLRRNEVWGQRRGGFKDHWEGRLTHSLTIEYRWLVVR